MHFCGMKNQNYVIQYDEKSADQNRQRANSDNENRTEIIISVSIISCIFISFFDYIFIFLSFFGNVLTTLRFCGIIIVYFIFKDDDEASTQGNMFFQRVGMVETDKTASAENPF